MNTEAFTHALTCLRRVRFPSPPYRSTDEFKSLSDEEKVIWHERVGICVGEGPCTHEAFLLARADVEEFRLSRAGNLS